MTVTFYVLIPYSSAASEHFQLDPRANRSISSIDCASVSSSITFLEPAVEKEAKEIKPGDKQEIDSYPQYTPGGPSTDQSANEGNISTAVAHQAESESIAHAKDSFGVHFFFIKTKTGEAWFGHRFQQH